MKNIKFILLCLLAVFLFCSFGCGGGVSDNLVSENNENQQPTDDEDSLETAIERLLDELLAIREDGSFALFDYSPLFDEMETGGTELKFAKYISNKDLVSGVSKDCFIQKIQLDAGTDYIIKYSHAGRNLNQTALDLKITMPDSREMIPDFIGISNITITKTPYAEEDFGDKSGLDAGDAARGLTLEQVLAEEMELEAKANAETTIEPYYVSADFEVIPEENPCIILYSFKVPVSGNYEFTIKENVLTSGDQFNVTDSPFEFRLYSVNFSEDDSGKEDYGDYYIELTPRGMLDLQRFLLDMATKFNENGLPIEFESSQSDEFSASGFMPASYQEVRQEVRNRLNELDGWLRTLAREEEEEKRWGNTPRLWTRLWRIQNMQRMLERKKEEEVSNVQVIVDPIINNVPYDDIFDAGAGFYAHSGMHAITGNAINDDDFSDNAVVNFNAPNPANGNAENMKSTLKATLIGTEEEHDSVKELDATSNFALIRNALGLNKMKDYIRIGSVGAKTMVVRHDYIEESPRYFTTDKYKLNYGALALLKKDPDLFQREHGDYFVAGYTWGLRYEATIEITAGEFAHYSKRTEKVDQYGKYYAWDGNSDRGVVCDKAAELLKELFECSKRVAENDNADDKNRVENLLDILTKNDYELDRNKYEERFHNLNISVKTGTHTGTVTNETQNLRDFVNDLTNYIRNAKNRKKSEYAPIYVTLVRYRELEEAKPYIPEYLPVTKDLYNRIRELTTKIYRTRCYYNALAAIPDAHLIGGSSLRASWEREFSGLVDGMKLSLNKICSNMDSVNSYYDNFDKLFQKYKSLCERYTFFRYFLNESNKDYGGGWGDNSSGTGAYFPGFWSYDKSKIVQEDFAAGISSRFDHQEPCTSGPGGAHFYISWSDQRVTGFETGYVDTNYSTGHDNQNRTLGKRKINWSYKCASSRRMEVYLKYRTVRMTNDLYPFAGFDD